MNSTSPLSQLVDELSRECPVCGRGPNNVYVLGPDKMVVEGCGLKFDSNDWPDGQIPHDGKESNAL